MPGSPVRLLYVGRLYGRKNAPLLPEILSRCIARNVDAQLTIVGKGPDGPDVDAALERLGLRDRVAFRDVPDETALYELYRDHHMLLFPSLPGEGLGLVLLEAQANGCVPLASRLPGVTDYALRDGETGRLVDVGDAEGFARAIAELAESATWQAMSRQAMAYVTRHFSPGRTRAELLAVVDAIQAGHYPIQRALAADAMAQDARLSPWPAISRALYRRVCRLAASLAMSR